MYYLNPAGERSFFQTDSIQELRFVGFSTVSFTNQSDHAGVSSCLNDIGAADPA